METRRYGEQWRAIFVCVGHSCSPPSSAVTRWWQAKGPSKTFGRACAETGSLLLERLCEAGHPRRADLHRTTSRRVRRTTIVCRMTVLRQAMTVHHRQAMTVHLPHAMTIHPRDHRAQTLPDPERRCLGIGIPAKDLRWRLPLRRSTWLPASIRR
jgi:hypothetical protein